MSNTRKVSLFFCLSCENQFITSLVFFHWFNLHFDLISVLILSKIYLLTLPISVFDCSYYEVEHYAAVIMMVNTVL